MTQISCAILILLCAAFVYADTGPKCPLHQRHGDEHLNEVDRRGDQVMGFSHKEAKHQFLLKADGGEIRISANNSANDEIRQAIRQHLQIIEKEFRNGVFEKPLAIHEQIPPGVETMKAKKEQIEYIYQETKTGGVLKMKTKDSVLVDAIHQFLRFQIREHRTDSPGLN